MSAPLTRKVVAIPLRSHNEIVAALHVCAMIGNDNDAVVMLKGYAEDWEAFTGIYLSDYCQCELDEADCFAGYEEPQLWVTLRPVPSALEGGAL